MEWSKQGVRHHGHQYVDINKNRADQTLKAGDEVVESEKGQIEKSDYSERTELQTQTETDQSGVKSPAAPETASQPPSLSSSSPYTVLAQSSSSTSSTSTSSSSSSSLPVTVASPSTQQPTHFNKGSIIQLANGSTKPVEDLLTEDFIQSARVNQDVFLDQSTLVKIEPKENSDHANLTFSVGKDKLLVRVTAPSHHPFFVYNRSWSSLSPRASLARYGLQCSLLTPGDVCISLTQTNR